MKNNDSKAYVPKKGDIITHDLSDGENDIVSEDGLYKHFNPVLVGLSLDRIKEEYISREELNKKLVEFVDECKRINIRSGKTIISIPAIGYALNRAFTDVLPEKKGVEGK